ncbi:MAG: thermonuclease family protein [Dongiaceae bacterium]
MRRDLRVLMLGGAAMLLATGETVAAEQIGGPVRAEVIRVIDGDTIEARAQLWIGLSLISRIRIRGIDTPEMRGGCLAEKTLAAAARDLLAELAGEAILITNIENDKYGGRVIADAAAGNGADLGSEMVARGLARPYDGEARADWCPVASIGG